MVTPPTADVESPRYAVLCAHGEPQEAPGWWSHLEGRVTGLHSTVLSPQGDTKVSLSE